MGVEIYPLIFFEANMTQRKQFLSYQRISSLSSVQTLTIPPNCDYLEIQALTQNVYLTFDNTTGSATNGITLVANGIYGHEVHPAAIIKVNEAAASADVRINYFKINEAI